MATVKLGKIQSVDGLTYFIRLKYERQASDDEDYAASILLTDVKRAWQVHLDVDYFRSQAKRMKWPCDKYLSTTVSCLSGEECFEKGTKYIVQVNVLNEGGGDVELVWKRELVDHDIFYKLGSAVLKETDATESVGSMLSYEVDRIKEYEMNIAASKEREEKLLKESKTFLDKLESYVSDKERWEKELYATFAAVLNEKKAEIRRLKKSQLEMTTSSNDNKTIDEKKKADEPCAKKLKVLSSKQAESTEEEEDDDEEEEEEHDTPVVVERRRRRTVATANNDSSSDLLLDFVEDNRPIKVSVIQKTHMKMTTTPTPSTSASSSSSSFNKPQDSSSDVTQSTAKKSLAEENTLDADALLANL